MSVLHRSVRHLLAVLLLSAIAAPTGAWAWGNEGHRVTGLVANELLTAKTRIRLNQLLPNYNLGEVANEMDVNRNTLGIELPGSDTWHYDNQPLCGIRPYAAYCPKGECASAKIPEFFRTLADASAAPEARAQAARFLIHLVGDIHQPLHVADDADLGGNQKSVTLPGAQFPRKLHAVWDSDLVKLTLRGISEADFAGQLVARFRQKEIAGWQNGEVSDWMTESYALSRDLTYGKLPEFTCGVPWPAEKVVALPAAYVDAAREVIPLQLAKAGARIAWLLNRALDASPEIATPAPKAAAPFAKANPGPVSAYVALIRLRSNAGKLPDDAATTRALVAHTTYWQEQMKFGRALVAGGLTGDERGTQELIVFEAGSPQQAEAVAANDPAVKAKLFQVQVLPYDLSFISNKYGAEKAKLP